MKRIKAWIEIMKARGRCALCTPFCKYCERCAEDLEDEYYWNF